MVRRNLFQPPPPPKAEDAAPETKSRFPNTGAMSGVRATLKDVASNAVRDIPVEFIEEDGPKDRLPFSDDDIAPLADSIRAHGQQVPIMVRPVTDRPGHYLVVYGRRRLRALRALGQPAKALVRSLTDEQAILAQGQENAQRLDPSFIEKSLFAAELTQGGYDQAVVLDALAIDKPMLSRMTKVATAIPAPVIEVIGSAHGIGRRRWEDLADTVRKHTVDLESVLAALDLSAARGSDARFALISDAVRRAAAAPTRPKAATQSVTLKDGTSLAQVSETARGVTVKLSKKDTPEFARWLHENAETELMRLYEVWRSAK